MTAQALPPQVREYLASAHLQPLWTLVRARLERNNVTVTGTVTLTVDDEQAVTLAGLGIKTRRGTARVRLEALDAALRRSTAAQGLVTVVEALTGPLVDRKQVAADRREEAAGRWVLLERQLLEAGLADQPWVNRWMEDLRRTGALSRTGDETGDVVRRVVTVLTALLSDQEASAYTPAWELGWLASTYTGSAHGLDAGTVTASLVLRALAAAYGLPTPVTAAERREVWARAGVSTDEVSGTVLTWGLRPVGEDRWAQMMRLRADLGLVTHVTMQEWRTAAATVAWAEPGQPVWACENPQVLQAAAGRRVDGPVLCLAGQPATVGSLVVQALVAAQVQLRYHGDFDPAGLTIAGRLFTMGAAPWRMGARDYLAGVTAVQATGDALPIEGAVPTTPWDPDLAAAMRTHQVAIHEEQLLEELLADLAT